MPTGRLVVLLIGSIVAANACAKAPDPPAYRPTATIKDLMDSVVDPSADWLWDAVAMTISAAGVEEKAPRTDDEWKEAKRNAVRLVEATNLLMMPDRLVARPGERPEHPEIELSGEQIQKIIDGDRADFMRLVQALYETSLPLLKATEARDAKALLESGDALDAACENCHLKYWYPNEKRPTTAPSLRDRP